MAEAMAIAEMPRVPHANPDTCVSAERRLSRSGRANGILNGMITTIDKAGRIVVPKRLRDAMGLTPQTQLNIDVVEGRLIVEFAPTVHRVDMAQGFPVIRSERDPAAPPLTDELVRDALEEVRDERTARFV